MAIPLQQTCTVTFTFTDTLSASAVDGWAAVWIFDSLETFSETKAGIYYTVVTILSP